jgi:hypothetical protein
MVAMMTAAVGLACLAAPAAAGIRTVQGQTFWTGDPGPVDPGNFYSSGQAQADPHHYLSYYGGDPQDYKMVIYAEHTGAARCVWRKRVVNSNWEFRHPYLMVCRP